jgi:MinD superfamily P-loop ATPase
MSSRYTISVNCMSCGACAAMCPQSAIIAAKRQYVIRKTDCSGCGSCVGYCPYRAIVKRPSPAHRAMRAATAS